MQHLQTPMAVLHDPHLNTLIAGGGDDSDQGRWQVRCDGRHRELQQLPGAVKAYATPQTTMPIAGGGDSDQGPWQARCHGGHRKLQQLPGAVKAYATPQSHI